MTWFDFASNWTASLSAIKRRFPLLEANTFSESDLTQDDFIVALARRHDLTTDEATEEIRDLALVSALARSSGELQDS